MEQKVIITKSAIDINEWLSRGWKVVSVTAQHVAITGTSWQDIWGNFCFVIEREIIEQ